MKAPTPPRGIVGPATDRVRASVAAADRLAAKFRGLIRAAVRAASKGDRRLLRALPATMERVMAVELRRVGEREARAWARAFSALGVRREAKAPEPTPGELERISRTRIAGATWLERLRAHLPSAEALDAASRQRDGGKALARLLARPASRVSTLVRTESYRVSQAMQDRESSYALGGTLIGWRYATQHDDRVRPEHEALDGTVFLLRGPNAKPRIPVPNGPGCFLPDTPVSGAFVAALRADYDGEVVEFATAEGHRATVTPNHPVATVDGFVSAGSIEEGMELVTYRSCVDRGPGAPAEHDERDAPASIHEVFRALAEIAPQVRARASAEHLHGDARHAVGHVDVVGPLCELADREPSEIRDDLGDPCLVNAGARHEALSPDGTASALLFGYDAPARRAIGGFDLARHGDGVSLDRDPLQKLRVGPAADLDLAIPEPTRERATADACAIADALERLASSVALDRVVKVERRAWTGHVYDLQAEGGWIMAGGILFRNCRCFYLPVVARPSRSR